MLKYAPNSYRVINNLGMAYADVGDYKEAEKIYSRAIALNQYNPVAYHNLGNTYKATGERELAEKYFLIAIEKSPGFSFSYKALVQLYLENGQYKKARQILERYLNHTSLRLDVLFMLACIAVEENNLDLALRYLEDALNIDVKNKNIKEFIVNVRKLMPVQG